MRVLMFGWEFPPHITGGLGTASYGLTRGMSTLPDVDMLFVVPRAYGDEDQSAIRLIGAGDVPITRKRLDIETFRKKFDYLEVASHLIPYMDPEEYEKIHSREEAGSSRYLHIDEEGRIVFSGKYGPGLLDEIANYALVAGIIGRDEEFDLIHAHDWLAYPAGIAAKIASGKPLIIHVHATDFDRSGGNVNPDVYTIEKRGMEAADRIIAVSNLTRSIVIEKYGIPPEKVITVYNAVEPLEEHKPKGLRKGVDDKIVTFLGRITMQKGPEYFIEAAFRVLKKMRNVRFIMAGSGDLMEKMILRAAQLRITDRFHFTGFLKGDDVFDMLRMSDLYIMPSVSEPFGISPLEAMQSNVPVIISRQSGVAEILTYVITVDFWDIDTIADSIYGLLNYPALSAMFKKYGKIEVDNLRWEESARQVRDVYYDVLNQGKS
ncbi:MAG TPA: glycosyltransferase family 1 protein [Bacteroidetes bacterium]|nr:glycosyltransferase family 1 protein [Bacteroidota bacterium]